MHKETQQNESIKNNNERKEEYQKRELIDFYYKMISKKEELIREIQEIDYLIEQAKEELSEAQFKSKQRQRKIIE